MFGFRYHVATLSALFIMLGLGILIGSTSNVSSALIGPQASTIKSLSSKLDGVLQESERDHALLSQQEQALSLLTPNLVNKKLAGKTIAIVRTGDYADAAAAAAAAITAAGGTVSSTTVIAERLRMLDDSQTQSVLHELKAPASVGSEDALAQMLHPLAALLRLGGTARPDLLNDLNMLQQDNLITVTGDYSAPVSAVVVVGGSMDQASNPTEASLLSELTDSTARPMMTIVGCESYDAANSSFPDFSNAGISSVDCIDMPLGALDLPFALRGAQGAFGCKKSATQLLPNSLTTSPSS